MQGPVVDEPNAVEPGVRQHGPDLLEIDVPAEQVGDLATGVPRLVVLEPVAEALEEQRGRAGVADLLVDGALARHHAIGQELLLPVDHDPRADLVDVGAGPMSRASSKTWAFRRPE